MGIGFCGGQHAGRQGGAGAPACGEGVCAVPLFSGVGPIIPEKAAARMAAHPALAVKVVVRFPLALMVRWDLPPIPLNTGRDLPSIRPSTGGGAHCYKCVWCLCVLFGGDGG